MHVVLSRRPATSAVIWVGLVWFAPILGVLAYVLFGVNRVQRRAAQVRREAHSAHDEDHPSVQEGEVRSALSPGREHLETLAGLGDRLTSRPVRGGNRVVPLRDGDETYPAMLEAIGQARRSVTLATYIFDNDEAGRRFTEALADAVARGVEVRVLIDDVGARYSMPATSGPLRRAGVPTARFHPAFIPWAMAYLNLRNHRKILVVDGETGFTGGMNIRVGHWLGQEPSNPVRDLHFRVEGPVVQDLQRVFVEDWGSTTGEWLSGETWFPGPKPVGDVLARGISDGPDIDYDTLPSVLHGALSVARSHVRIMTPYFIPTPTLTEALGVTAMRGVRVELYLPGRSNLAMVDWASRAHWAPLLERDCRIHLMPPASFDHSKLMVVDGAWVLLGSANWDPRSLYLNFEFNLECYSPRLAGDVEAVMTARTQGAREVTQEDVEARPLPLRLRDGVARLLSPYL